MWYVVGHVGQEEAAGWGEGTVGSRMLGAKLVARVSAGARAAAAICTHSALKSNTTQWACFYVSRNYLYLQS